MSRKTTKIIIISLTVLLVLMLLVIGLLFLDSSRSNNSTYDDVVEKTPEPSPDIVEVERIIIELDGEVLKGSRVRPIVIIQPENATDKSYELSSDNERVLRPQGNHFVAESIGETNLIATASNGVIGFITVIVEAPYLESLTFEEDELNIQPGDMVFLTPVITPEDALLREPIIYKSSDERVVLVSHDGRLTAVSSGTAIITGTVGELSDEVKVNVVVPVRRIIVSMSRRVYSVGEEAEFTIQVEPEDATNASVTVTYSGAAVTSTGENSFRCDAAGEVTITFTALSGSSEEIVILVHDLQAFADEVHRLTNSERANAGLSQLGRNQILTQIALVRARETIVLFSHTRPDGREFHTVYGENGIVVFDENGFAIRWTGENLAAGQTSPAEAVQGWMDSRGHRDNMLNRNFGEMGVGVVMDNNGRLYWTQMFLD